MRIRNEDPIKNPKNWIIEGSNTDFENDWIILDERENFVNSSVHKSFFIEDEILPNECYKYFQIGLTGSNSNDDKVLLLSAIYILIWAIKSN